MRKLFAIIAAALALAPASAFAQTYYSPGQQGTLGPVTAATGQNGLSQLVLQPTNEPAGVPNTHIATNATTTVKTGAGVLHSICINTKGATANTATVYDNTAGSGTKIAALDTTAQLGCLAYDAAFSTGLTVVTATGTAADLTITYR